MNPNLLAIIQRILGQAPQQAQNPLQAILARFQNRMPGAGMPSGMGGGWGQSPEMQTWRQTRPMRPDAGFATPQDRMAFRDARQDWREARPLRPATATTPPATTPPAMTPPVTPPEGGVPVSQPNPQGNAYGQRFFQQYGIHPGGNQEQFQAFKAANPVKGPTNV
jgi:hypothetical protein